MILALWWAACTTVVTLRADGAPEVRVTPATLALAEPACEADCCGLAGSACCGRAAITLDAGADRARVLSGAWDPLRGSRLRVAFDPRTCAADAPVAPSGRCEAPGSVDVGPAEQVACDLVWDVIGAPIPPCADAPWGEPCADEPPIDGGYLTLTFDEGAALSIYAEVTP